MIFTFGALYFFSIFIKNTKSSEIIYAGSQSKTNKEYSLNENNTKFFFEISLASTNEGIALEEKTKK